jgi:hypothetical protein
MATLKKIRLPDGKEITLADWGAYPLRTSLELVNTNGTGVAPSEIRVFTYTVGQQVPTTNRNADELDCNNALPSQMPVDEEMLVYTMQVEADPRCNPQTMQSIVLRTLFTLSVGGIKNYTDGPITRYPSGGGIAGFSVIANASVISNGVPGVHAAKQMAIPVHIGGGEKFWGIYRFFQRQEALAGPLTNLTPIRLVNDGGALIPDMPNPGWEPRQMVLYLDGLRKRPLS